MGGGSLSRPLATYLIDDPVERDSSQSYFVQLADLNADGPTERSPRSTVSAKHMG